MSTSEDPSGPAPDDAAPARPADQAPNAGRSADEPAEGGDDTPGAGPGSPRG